MNRADVLKELRNRACPRNAEGMARYGITRVKALGVPIPFLRELARRIGRDHTLAGSLWRSGIHEARILAGMIEDPLLVTEDQVEAWVRDFSSWDLCDQCCMNLFEDMPSAYRKCKEWSSREEEFVLRAGYVLMARLAVSDRKATDEHLTQFFPLLREGALDGRNYVKKAVSWALRQIGKRNRHLNAAAVREAKDIQGLGSPSALWIARDVLHELQSPQTQARLKVSRGNHGKKARH